MNSLILVWLYVGIFTFHGNTTGANGVHSPIGIEIQHKTATYGYLWYVNTFKDPSTLVYITGNVDNKTVRLNYLAFISHGYTEKPVFFVLPFISARYGNLRTDLSCVPNATHHINCAITFKLKWSE